MKAINTIPRGEYADRLFEAMRRMSKKISRLADEEDSLSQTADNKGDEEKALRHTFNRMALFWASEAITMSPNKLKEALDKGIRSYYDTARRNEKSLDCQR